MKDGVDGAKCWCFGHRWGIYYSVSDTHTKLGYHDTHLTTPTMDSTLLLLINFYFIFAVQNFRK